MNFLNLSAIEEGWFQRIHNNCNLKFSNYLKYDFHLTSMIGRDRDRDIDPYDWIRRFFNSNSNINRFGSQGFGISDFFDMNLFRDIDEIQSQMQRMFEQFDKSNSDTTPKVLVKEYEASDGSKIRRVGPIVYGYSMTIDKDGKPVIREFGNVRSSKDGFGMGSGRTRPELTDEREPLIDIHATSDRVIVVLEMPGVKKEDIKLNAFKDSIEVQSIDPKGKYYKIIELSEEIDIDSAKSRFNNGVLEIILNKKEKAKSKGKEIRIE
jgi:HSP20 family protein